MNIIEEGMACYRMSPTEKSKGKQEEELNVTKVENVWADLRTTCARLGKRGLGNCRAHETKREVHACAACAVCAVCTDWAGCTVWSASSYIAQSVHTAQRTYAKNQNIWEPLVCIAAAHPWYCLLCLSYTYRK
jgi:hypothetical protein